MNVKNCIRCGQWFVPSEPNHCICGNCAGQMESRAVLYWFIAFVLAVGAICAWYFINGLQTTTNG